MSAQRMTELPTWPTSGINIRAAGGREWPAGDQPADMRREAKAAGCAEVRRGNRLSCMALIGARDCVGNERPATDTAVHLASSYGNVADTARLVEGLLRDGQPPSPLAFINASTNMAGFYVARELGIDGPGLMVARGPQSLLAVLELLGQDGATGQHLVGAVEECAWPLAAHRQRLGLPADAPLAEASYWLWLDADDERPLAQLHWLQRFDTVESLRAALSGSDNGKPLFLAHGPTLVSSAIEIPARATPLALPGDCPHAQVARLLAEFCQRPEPARLLLVEREPEAANYLALLLERTTEPAAARQPAEVDA